MLFGNGDKHAPAVGAGTRAGGEGAAKRLDALAHGGEPHALRGAAEGMGLASMRERIEALGGTFTAGPRAGANGWRVFVTVPKQQGDEDR